jgi:hypothetical protein
MVAFNATRRSQSSYAATGRLASAASLLDGEDSAYRSENRAAAGSRRFVRSMEIVRDARNSITSVRIGRWRVVTATAERRIEEARELIGGRAAVRIRRLNCGTGQVLYEIWQLYDLDGRLAASLQTSLDGSLALISDYEGRRGARLSRNSAGSLESAESWAL